MRVKVIHYELRRKRRTLWGDDADGLIPKGYQAQTEVVVARLKVKMERLFPILRTLKSIA